MITLFYAAVLLTALLILSSCSGTGNTGTDSRYEVNFAGTVLENNGTNLLIEPESGSDVLRSADKITVHVSGDMVLVDSQGREISIDSLETGDMIQILYDGAMAESYPAQINKCYKIVLMN